MKCGSGTSHLWKSWQNKCGKRNFRSLPVKAERKCGSRTSHFWESMQNESADVELQIFGSKDKAESEHQVFGSQSRPEVWKRNFRSLAVKTERKCRSSTADFWQSSQVGRAEADLNIFDRPISYWLSLPMLKNNSTLYYWRTFLSFFLSFFVLSASQMMFTKKFNHDNKYWCCEHSEIEQISKLLGEWNLNGSLLSLDLRSHQNILLILMLSDEIVVSNKIRLN